jgi:hypothetical protein
VSQILVANNEITGACIFAYCENHAEILWLHTDLAYSSYITELLRGVYSLTDNRLSTDTPIRLRTTGKQSYVIAKKYLYGAVFDPHFEVIARVMSLRVSAGTKRLLGRR